MDLSTREGRRQQGLIIQRAIERAGFSVDDLAARIGCSRALLYQYLSGATLAQPDRLQQIASETGVPLAFFYGADIRGQARPPRRGIQREQTPAAIAERIRQLEELADAQESPADWAALASTCERILSLAMQAGDAGAEARASLRLGRARIRVGDFGRAIHPLELAIDRFAAGRDSAREMDARQALGNALLAAGRGDEARVQFERAASSRNWRARWAGAVSLAAVEEQAGNYQSAMAWCNRAGAVLEQGTDPQAAAVGALYVNANRINLYLAGGDFGLAHPLARACVEDAESLGVSDQHLEARLNVGACDLYTGRWAEGLRILAGAVSLARLVGDHSRESVARAFHSMTQAATGEFDAAIREAKDALAEALSSGDHRAELFAQIALSDAYLAPGRADEARYHADRALAVADSLRLRLYQAECRLRLSRVCLDSGKPDDALDHASVALTSAETLGARHVIAASLVLRADALLRTSGVESAERDAGRGVSLARELGMAPVEWEGEGLRARILSAYDPPHITAAEEASTRAVVLIESARESLRDAGFSDAILESPRWQSVYLERAMLMFNGNRRDDAERSIQEAGWPPLVSQFHRMAGAR